MRYAVLAVVLLLFAAPALPVVAGADAPTDDVAFADLGTTVTSADPGASAASAHASNPGDQQPALQEFTATPETELRILLREDRSARWTITVRYELADENETAAFREVAEAFETGETGPQVDPFRNYAAAATEATDREMEITDVERETTVDEEPDPDTLENIDAVAVGELHLAFTWSSFLDTDGEQLVLGDAFLTSEESTWLRSLGADQTMYIRTPEGYAVSSTPGVAVPIEDNEIVVEGPRTFEDGERIQAVYEPVGAAPSDPPWGLISGAVVAAALIIAAGLLLYRRMETASEEPPTESALDATGATAGTTTAESETSDEAGGADTEASEPEDLSLLSDEERVERLLEQHGGRMRQADIVQETGWSDAKVSQLLSSMAGEGRVEKLRLGRENLISLPDDDNEERIDDDSEEQHR